MSTRQSGMTGRAVRRRRKKSYGLVRDVMSFTALGQEGDCTCLMSANLQSGLEVVGILMSCLVSLGEILKSSWTVHARSTYTS